jgi:hypothetical protein
MVTLTSPHTWIIQDNLSFKVSKLLTLIPSATLTLPLLYKATYSQVSEIRIGTSIGAISLPTKGHSQNNLFKIFIDSFSYKTLFCSKISTKIC